MPRGCDENKEQNGLRPKQALGNQHINTRNRREEGRVYRDGVHRSRFNSAGFRRDETRVPQGEIWRGHIKQPLCQRGETMREHDGGKGERRGSEEVRETKVREERNN